MGHTCKNMEVSGAENYSNCGAWLKKFQKGVDFNRLPGDHSHDILVEDMAAFYTYQKMCLRLN